MLRFTNTCSICMGNDDNKFKPLVTSRKGKFMDSSGRDLRYLLIWQYIDTVIEYRIVILCFMNIEVSKWLCSVE